MNNPIFLPLNGPR